MFRQFTLFILFSIPFGLQGQQAKLLDSIYELRSLARNDDYSLEVQLEYAKNASQLSYKLNIDSTILKSDRLLSGNYLFLDMYKDYKSINIKNLERAKRLKDSSTIAYALQQLGWYYDYNAIYDSAYSYYYNAQKFYSILGQKQREAEVLASMAYIQGDESDFVGAEKNIIAALKLVEMLPKSDETINTTWELNNQLGIVATRFKQYDVALSYYNKNLEVSEQHNTPFYYVLATKNNIGNIYNKLGEHDKALPLFEEVASEKRLLQLNEYAQDLYNISLSNLANTKSILNGNDQEIKELFNRAYKLSDSLGNDNGKMIVTSYKADYFLKNKALDSALFAAKESYKIAKELEINDYVLKSLKQLAKASPKENSKSYLDEYIKLSDSLRDNERVSRNKFARIEFETDKLKEEKEQAARERLIFLLSSIGLLVTLILIYVIITQRAKNRELEFTKQQQEANEEIYNLMLAQQDKIDEGRTKEKKRISEELHDGILGRLFGTRLSLDSLNLQHTEEAIKTREQYISELKSIEQEIRKISHDLNVDFVTGRSFSDILEGLVNTQMQAYQLNYVYEEDEKIDWDAISNKTKIHVYRMLQETMQNIYKHAQAKNVKISFELKNSVILLMVEDDGLGFNTNKARKGIGLKNFESRANALGGKVEIFSQPEQGTKVMIHIPIL